MQKVKKWKLEDLKPEGFDNLPERVYYENMALNKVKTWVLKHRFFVFSIFFVLGWLIADTARAEVVSYSRNPSGSEVTSPVTINVTLSEEPACIGEGEAWKVRLSSDINLYYSPTTTGTSLEYTYVLPPETPEEGYITDYYYDFVVVCSSGSYIDTLEEGDPLFVIVEETTPPQGGVEIFPPMGEAMSSMASSAGTTTFSFLPLIGIIAGISLALGFAKAIIEWIKEAKKQDREMKKLYKEAEKQHDILHKK